MVEIRFVFSTLKCSTGIGCDGPLGPAQVLILRALRLLRVIRALRMSLFAVEVRIFIKASRVSLWYINANMTGEKMMGSMAHHILYSSTMDPMGDCYFQKSPFLIGIASMGHVHLQRVAEQAAKELNKKNAMCSLKNCDSTFLFLWCCYSISVKCPSCLQDCMTWTVIFILSYSFCVSGRHV